MFYVIDISHVKGAFIPSLLLPLITLRSAVCQVLSGDTSTQSAASQSATHFFFTLHKRIHLMLPLTNRVTRLDGILLQRRQNLLSLSTVATRKVSEREKAKTPRVHQKHTFTITMMFPLDARVPTLIRFRYLAWKMLPSFRLLPIESRVLYHRYFRVKKVRTCRNQSSCFHLSECPHPAAPYYIAYSIDFKVLSVRRYKHPTIGEACA